MRALFLVCKWPSSPCVLTWWRAERREGEKALLSLVLRALALFMRAPLLWPNYHPKVPFPNVITWGFQQMNCGGAQTFSPWHLLNQKLWDWGPHTCVGTNPPGDRLAHSSCRNTALDWQAEFSSSHLLISLSHSQTVLLPWENQAIRTCQTSKDVAFKILWVRWVLL